MVEIGSRVVAYGFGLTGNRQDPVAFGFVSVKQTRGGLLWIGPPGRDGV